MLELNTTKSATIPIKIDQAEYEMIPYDQLSLRDFLELQKFASLFEATQGKDLKDLEDTQLTEMESSVDKFCKIVLPGVEDKIWELLSYANKIKIMEVFMPTVPKVEASTGKNNRSSQDSQDSMVKEQIVG